MEPTIGAGDRWIKAAHDRAMEGSTAAAKGGCLAAIGVGIVSASGAMMRGLWHGLTGKVNDQEIANTESAHALDLIGRGVLGLIDSNSLKTQEDHKNLGTMEALASEILGLQRDPKVPEEAKTDLAGWLRSANMIVTKGHPQEADKELKALQHAVKELKTAPEETDVKAIHAAWQNDRRTVRKENTDELAGMAKGLINRSYAAASTQGMRGRVTLGDQNPNVPRPGSPPSPPSPPKPA